MRRAEERKFIPAAEKGGWMHGLAAGGGLRGRWASGVRRGQPAVGGSAQASDLLPFW